MWCGSGSIVLAVCRILLCGHHCFFNTPPPQLIIWASQVGLGVKNHLPVQET